MVSLNPEAALARELFDYSPETGLLTKKETGKSDWGKQKHGHMLVRFLGKMCKVHRVIWLWVTESISRAVLRHARTLNQ